MAEINTFHALRRALAQATSDMLRLKASRSADPMVREQLEAQADPGASSEEAATHIVCAFEEGSFTMTPRLWARVLEERLRLGRPLDEDDLAALQSADRTEDRDA